MNHLDRRFHDNFSRFEFYNKYYGTFQVMNFLRILQYSKSKSIADYVFGAIEEMVSE
jgi:hypothetical protein